MAEKGGGWQRWGLLVVALGGGAVLLAAGCTVETRYRVLAFFFEGVPPPGGPPAWESEVTGAMPGRGEPVSFHTAYREDRCADCHIDRKAYLKSPVPDLCRQCHTRPADGRPWNHAPARVGDCLACHVGHESVVADLLRADGSTLCFTCHRNTYIEGLPAHNGVDLATCQDCHSAHEGGSGAIEAGGSEK